MWGAVLPEYAELYCLTNFSFLHGASHAQELVARASSWATTRWPSRTSVRWLASCAPMPWPSGPVSR